MNINDNELKLLISLAKRALWASPDLRRKIQKEGVNIVPSNFYSEVPTIDEIEASFEYMDKKNPLYSKIFDEVHLEKIIRELLPYSDEFKPPLLGDLESPEGFFWKNPAFSMLDAVSYYCMIRHFKPQKILEVGSGFSTLVADMAIQKNGFGSIVSIEPFPKPFLKQISSVSSVVEKKVQDISQKDLLNMVEESDIWFIDSTHTVKVGSDCLYLYLHIMPEVSSKTIVHSHDIYLPFGIDQDNALEKHVYWTEQYLLYAFLVNNPAAKVLFGSHYTYKLLNDQAKKFIHEDSVGLRGGSFWYSLNQ